MALIYREVKKSESSFLLDRWARTCVAPTECCSESYAMTFAITKHLLFLKKMMVELGPKSWKDQIREHFWKKKKRKKSNSILQTGVRVGFMYLLDSDSGYTGGQWHRDREHLHYFFIDAQFIKKLILKLHLLANIKRVKWMMLVAMATIKTMFSQWSWFNSAEVLSEQTLDHSGMHIAAFLTVLQHKGLNQRGIWGISSSFIHRSTNLHTLYLNSVTGRKHTPLHHRTHTHHHTHT